MKKLCASQFSDSLWRATSAPGPTLPRLRGDIRTGIAIIGAGFTGLAAAHHLAAAGVECAVIEANDVGWGASGRNGGMAVLRYKTSWARLAQAFGDAAARDLHKLLLHAFDLLEMAVQAYGVDCGFARCGHITAAHGGSALQMFERDLQWLAAIGDRAPRQLDAAETAALTGTECYRGGYLDRRAGAIRPLDFVRGFAAGIAAKGVPIYVQSPMRRLREEGATLVLETSEGSVRAEQALVATNAYTELESFGTDLGARVVPVSTSAVSTEPLGAALASRIMPQGHVVSDTRHLLNWFRFGPGNRLVYGGRASLTGKEAPEVYAGLERKLIETFPMLEATAIEHQWSGKVAVTLDDFPHVGRLTPRIVYARGDGGRGVVLAQLLGKLVARLAMGERSDAGPMSAAAFTRIPLQPLRIPAMQAVAGYYGLLDRLRW
jgi:glycine/D-amino acid oxidase-like deaminating enzyme